MRTRITEWGPGTGSHSGDRDRCFGGWAGASCQALLWGEAQDRTRGDTGAQLWVTQLGQKGPEDGTLCAEAWSQGRGGWRDWGCACHAGP